MSGQPFEMPGALVEIPLSSLRPLDGFLLEGDRRYPLLVFVHGMHSNFYRSVLKKALMQECRRARIGMLSFNNRGAEEGTNDERFKDCLSDLDAAIRFGRSRGYRSFVLAGHSTGCQKITYYQAVRGEDAVRGLVLLAIGDDLAIMKRDLGKNFSSWVRRARAQVRRGAGSVPLGAPVIPPFSARRFLSIADPDETEARIFDFERGALDHFRRVRCPVLALLAGVDEYETIRPRDMIARLRAGYRGSWFEGGMVKDADHGFHGMERHVAKVISGWVGVLNRRSCAKALKDRRPTRGRRRGRRGGGSPL